jgi:hypothetical protein
MTNPHLEGPTIRFEDFAKIVDHWIQAAQNHDFGILPDEIGDAIIRKYRSREI